VDFQINQGLFSQNNTFGLIISVIGTTPGYGMFAIIGGGFLTLFFKKNEYKTWMRVFFLVATLACLGSSTYFAGREFFGPNGFYWVAKRFWGYFIAFPVMALLTYVGYLLMRNVDNKNLWIILLVVLAAFVLALTGGVTLFKVIFHRPRYRALYGTTVPYCAWYERCADYKSWMAVWHLSSEEFKSFPSGHAAAAMGVPMIALFLPYIDEKYRKYRLPVFAGGLVFALLVMFCRMLVGAHYLSDVSMGSILVVICMIVAFEVLRILKKLKV
jgi:membrane-associated phospholipid phosphatase